MPSSKGSAHQHTRRTKLARSYRRLTNEDIGGVPCTLLRRARYGECTTPPRVLDVNEYRRGRGFIWVLTCCGRGPDVRPSTPLEHRGCFVLDVCQLDGATFVLERSAFCVELCPHETAAVACSPPIQVHGPTARVQRGVRPLNQCASAKMSACLLQCPPHPKKGRRYVEEVRIAHARYDEQWVVVKLRVFVAWVTYIDMLPGA